MENEGRCPAVSSVSEDKKLLSTLKSEVLEQVGVKPDIIDDEFVRSDISLSYMYAFFSNLIFIICNVL